MMQAEHTLTALHFVLIKTHSIPMGQVFDKMVVHMEVNRAKLRLICKAINEYQIPTCVFHLLQFII